MVIINPRFIETYLIYFLFKISLILKVWIFLLKNSDFKFGKWFGIVFINNKSFTKEIPAHKFFSNSNIYCHLLFYLKFRKLKTIFLYPNSLTAQSTLLKRNFHNTFPFNVILIALKFSLIWLCIFTIN